MRAGVGDAQLSRGCRYNSRPTAYLVEGELTLLKENTRALLNSEVKLLLLTAFFSSFASAKAYLRPTAVNPGVSQPEEASPSPCRAALEIL